MIRLQIAKSVADPHAFSEAEHLVVLCSEGQSDYQLP
jgi:hypothetical protein